MATVDMLSGYKNCERCSAPFSKLYVGGTGVWRTCIVCEECFHVRRGVPYMSVVVPLVALKYDLAEQEALKREQTSQEEYEDTILRWSIANEA